MRDRFLSYWIWQGVLGAIVIVPIAGCGGNERSTVTGTLLRHDGTPLVGARITARSEETGNWATGVTDAQGTFQLGSVKADDGLPAGEYYVTIVEERDNFGSVRPATISSKYERRTTSGLTLTVERGRPAVFDATLDPP